MSGPSFTRGEYWLLESAVEGMPPFNWLLSPNLDVIVNKAGHGLDRDALIDTLERLVAAGLVCAHHDGRADFSPTRSEIESAIDEPAGRGRHRSAVTHYGLTPAGGAAWEAFAAPDWTLFVRDSVMGRPLMHEVVGASIERLRLYLDALRTEVGIDEASMVADELRPWNATYWKELPVGYRVRFRAAEGPGWRVPSYDVRDAWYRWR